ncbi:MAG TPA: hypothetical protein PKO06_11210, partial [Candidatus Ozemobacteraceae bacterium]|nr:hypothetical protein [Candidatus Ozemobacteraceae bacterium]
MSANSQHQPVVSPTQRTHRFRHVLIILGFALLAGLMVTTGFASPSREERILSYLQFCSEVREAVIDGLPCPHSPSQVAAELASDPAGLASWVRSVISYEPTIGSNRGAAGTLAAMAGGDWDRALLLGEMLQAGGYSPRYVQVARTASETDALLASWLNAESRWRLLTEKTPVDASTADTFDEILTPYGLTKAVLRAQQASQTQVWSAHLSEALSPAESTATVIETAISKIGPASEAGYQALIADVRRAMQYRVLVEIDQDEVPLLFSAGPEGALPAVSACKDLSRLEGAPEELCARLSLAVTMPTSEHETKPASVTVFTWEKNLADLWQQPIRLEIVPVNVSFAEPPQTWAPAQWFERLSGFEQFQVVLRHGDEPLAGPVFTRDSTIQASSQAGRDEAAGNLGSGLGDLFGGTAEDASEPGSITPSDALSPAPVNSHSAPPLASTADAPASMTRVASGPARPLVLTLELHRPGRPVLRQQRLLIGALVPDRFPVYTADILAVGGPVGPLTAGWMALDAVTANAPIVGEVLGSNDPQRFEGRDGLKRFPGLLHEWQLGRLAIATRLLRNDPGLLLKSEPTVVMLSNQLRPEPTRKAVGMRVAIDVISDGTTLFPRQPEKQAAAFAANLRLGIAATRLETVLLSRYLPPPGPQGTFEPWAESLRDGRSPIAVRLPVGGDSSPVCPHPLAAWGMKAEESGRLLVFPGVVAPRVWWSI